MKTELHISLRHFPVWVEDQRTGEKLETAIVLEKSQLQACAIVGQSCDELISRLYARQGFTVLDIGTPEKLTIPLDLAGLWELHRPEEEGPKDLDLVACPVQEDH